MSQPKIRITLTGLLSVFALAACSSPDSARVPVRNPECASLVRVGELDTSGFDERNDARLGLDRAPIARSTVRSTAYTFDRQRVIDGRPYSDYRVTTRTASSLQR